jgi:hypothetical protein
MPSQFLPDGGLDWLHKSSKWSRLAAVLILGGAAFGVYLLISYWKLNDWLDDGAVVMEPFSTVLIHNGTTVDPDEPGSFDARLNAVLIETQTVGRRVKHMSRSAPRRGPLLRQSYVKVFMETTNPVVESNTVAIKFAARFREKNGRIFILGTDTLGL